MATEAKQLLLNHIKKLKQFIIKMKSDGQDIHLFYKTIAKNESEVKKNKENIISPEIYKSVIINKEPSNDMEKIMLDVANCQKCQLAQKRKHPVFGEGSIKPRLVFVGEAPGADEDREGRPFVGEAGKLLTKIIESIGLKREEVYICNVLKCRPPGNRNPEAEEINHCREYLEKQLKYLKPEVICALGTFASQTLLESRETISQLRGKVYEKNGIKIVPTFHPAALLYHPANKKLVWEDMKMIARLLKLPIGGK